MAWCWETERYETASEAAEIGARARAARKAKEEEEEAKIAWEAKKAGMSKRDRKKAEEKERKEAEAAAAEKAEAEAAAERAAEEAAAAEAARLADPRVQKEMAYAKQLNDSVRAVLEASLDRFLERAVALDREPKM